MNSKEKMLEIIKKKHAGVGKSKQTNTPKNDLKNLRKGPEIFNKSELQYFNVLIVATFKIPILFF